MQIYEGILFIYITKCKFTLFSRDFTLRFVNPKYRCKFTFFLTVDLHENANLQQEKCKFTH